MEVVKKKFQEVVNEKVININKITTGKYNEVYKIDSEKNSYIIRIFPNKEWPEEGKLKFVNYKLVENGILCPKIYEINYSDKDFENGFMIEEFIAGDNASELWNYGFSHESYFEGVARFVSSFHKVNIENYGYIGSGIANHNQFNRFIEMDINRFFNNIQEDSIFTEKEVKEIRDVILMNFEPIEQLPSVLCHNDIHPGNVIIRNGDFIMLDWDNAISSNWVQDFSTMTYWIQLLDTKENYRKYKKIFLDNYDTEFKVNDLDKVEATFHLYVGINLLSHFRDKKDLFEKALKNIREKIFVLNGCIN